LPALVHGGDLQGLARTLQLTGGDGPVEAAPVTSLEGRGNDQIESLPNGLLRRVAEDAHALVVPAADDSVSIGDPCLISSVVVFRGTARHPAEPTPRAARKRRPA